MGPDGCLQLSGRALRTVVCEIDGGEALESGPLIKTYKSPGGNCNWRTASMFEIRESCWPFEIRLGTVLASCFNGKGHRRILCIVASVSS